ncbi:MAG: glycosyltransferase [Spartobacteria bacterium]|nr:glycosyltransferase [Spartobacteria bacterium]
MKQVVAVIIPFLNEEKNLPEMYRRLTAVFAKRDEVLQMIFINDGSTDGSQSWLLERREQDDRIRVIELSRNFGHQIAITAGLDVCDADAAVIIDADLQDPPEVIVDMLTAWHGGGEVIYGVRKERKGETWLKKFFAAAFYSVFHKLAKVDVPLNAGDFRLVDRCVVDAMKQLRETHRFMRGLTCWVGFRQDAVYYDRDPRYAGETKYPVWKSIRLALDAITSFSASPLRWTMGFGLTACSLAFLWFFYILVAKFFDFGFMERGWASIIMVIIFMGGVQLISIGVLGQYLSRTYEETKGRPLYFIRKNHG